MQPITTHARLATAPSAIPGGVTVGGSKPANGKTEQPAERIRATSTAPKEPAPTQAPADTDSPEGEASVTARSGRKNRKRKKFGHN